MSTTDPDVLTGLPSFIEASWHRSMQHGLRRRDRALFSHSVTKALARNIEEENHSLVTHAGSEMRRLYNGLGSARWLALCINTRGQIVFSVGDRASAPRELRVLMHPGRRIIEAELGTTAPGCVLEERRPMVVTRGEHFLLELQRFFCASAPILTPDGQLAGALDITGVDVEVLPLASEMVGLAAKGIENSMFRATHGSAVLSFHCDERLLGTPFEALLKVGPDGRIAGANRTARQLLALGEDCAIGATLDSLFDGLPSDILHRPPTASFQNVRVLARAGSLSHVRIQLQEREDTPCTLTPSRQPKHTAWAPQGFVLEHTELAHAYQKALRVFRHGIPVLIEGETGTGKEIFARALHHAVRPNGPFLALNCAAIPEGLIEAELFGYADGAFTGGRKGGQMGKIEQARGGVLFLDEIGDMPFAMQSRLLRVTQEQTVTRIGDSREVSVDLLLICATHHHLEQMVASGQFREDLLYRLNGYILQLPPLRDRTDVAAIVEFLLRRWDAKPAAHGAGEELHRIITREAIDRLTSYPWPGNIRQLEQVIRTLVALRTTNAPISIADLPEKIRSYHAPRVAPSPVAGQGAGQLLEASEMDTIRSTLEAHRGNISSAARALGISRGTLYSKLKRLKSFG